MECILRRYVAQPVKFCYKNMRWSTTLNAFKREMDKHVIELETKVKTVDEISD